jgi:hypothetical protein
MHKSISNVLTVTASLIMLYQVPAFADTSDVDSSYTYSSFADFLEQDDACSTIVNNYLDAVEEYSTTVASMIPLSDKSYVTQVLKATEANITQDNLITFNALQADTGAIKTELKKHPNKALDEGYDQLHSQLDSMHTRVDEWKVTGCREKYSCDLGEAGYCSEKHID